jgi:hypothetical protein
MALMQQATGSMSVASSSETFSGIFNVSICTFAAGTPNYSAKPPGLMFVSWNCLQRV